jgi:integrase
MASTWILNRPTKSGGMRYRVMFRVGGRDATNCYAGSFATMREAKIRRDWVAGELAARRVPDLTTLAEPTPMPTLRDVSKRWQASRVDASENTRLQHRSAVRAMLPTLGDRAIDAITPAHVAELVAHLSAKGRKRETIRKTLFAGAMVPDFAGRASDNPFRDKVRVRLPREERTELAPSTAEHVLAVHDVLPHRHKLPLVVLDATGMRLGELERLAWGDVDEQRSRWRVSQAVSKTSRARWVNVHPTSSRPSVRS